MFSNIVINLWKAIDEEYPRSVPVLLLLIGRRDEAEDDAAVSYMTVRRGPNVNSTNTVLPAINVGRISTACA